MRQCNVRHLTHHSFIPSILQVFPKICLSNCLVRLYTAKHVKPHKAKGTIKRDHYFVDFVKTLVAGGKGGDGMLSFLSLPNHEWAGPDGGNGGHGGHVILQASHNYRSLSHLRAEIRAPNGVKGGTKHRDGKNAEHHILQVPLGTVIKSETGNTLASLDEPEALFVAARGGAGGKGNYFFLSNENRAPTVSELGALGQERTLLVELKTMAHAGLIGFPNAGKSTLLRAISRAQPKVSAYPFTTLNPHIGMVLYDDHEQIAVADIPGLIPGAHQNKGLGISFLRHIERCLCLIYVLDLSAERPWDQLAQLRYELNQYQPGLADRPNLLLGNKIDVPGAQERLEELKTRLQEDRTKTSKSDKSVPQDIPVMGISAKKMLGVEQLLHHLRVMYDSHSADNVNCLHDPYEDVDK
ncbi:mitochondrial ribosome-associated GTPase 2 [Aplysia californica]|uniref:Mitochondrial ribosome-associated GTPase 2 n=1 Tax=Aplysia californica TaxID=6500 RepID=A0ABM0JEU0_APLCA|nr:mitochondrial ribosome-associated GTPase 2 [Aplysia californica]